MISISVSGSDEAMVVKMQTDGWEANIHGSRDAFAALAGIEATDWAERRTLQIGTCAGAPVYWSRADELVSLLIGGDDESWDIGLLIPGATVDEILNQIQHPSR